MAMKPLTFYQQGAVAGMQQDQYSQAPGFVESKNLDIFSSSQSVKASRWTEPKTTFIFDKDERGRFELRADGRVWDRLDSSYLTDNSRFDTKANNYYRRGNPTTTYPLLFGIPQRIFASYEDKGINFRKRVTVVTDRLVYHYYSDYYYATIQGTRFKNNTIFKEQTPNDPHTVYAKLPEDSSKKEMSFCVNINEGVQHGKGEIRLRQDIKNNKKFFVKKIYLYKKTFVYNKEEIFEDALYELKNVTPPNSELKKLYAGEAITIPAEPFGNMPEGGFGFVKFELSAEEAGIESIFEVSLRVKEEFHYLTGREIKVTNNGTGFLLASQHKGYSFIDYKERRRNQLFHLLILSQEFEAEKGDNIVGILRNREGIVMAINAPGGGQIAFYNGQGARQESFLYPGFEFIKMEYLGDYLYIIAKERGVIGLYVRYGGTLKMALGAKTSGFEKKPLYEKERFSLNGMMVAWKSALYLGTKENSILKINKEGISSCILQVKGAIHSINERWHPEALAVVYQEGEDKKVIYNKENIQESVASYPLNTGGYQQEFSIVYPTIMQHHFLEKEPLEISISAMFPNKDSSIDVWLSVNEYHFWHFPISAEIPIEAGAKYRLEKISEDHELIFQEYTPRGLLFYYQGDLISDAVYKGEFSDQLVKISGNGVERINVQSVDHYCYLGRIQGKGYEHTTTRLTALTNRGNLPIVHLSQIKLECHNANPMHSIEIYGVNYESNQYNR